MVLADPGFVVAELVEQLDQLEVALDGQRRVLVERMERRDEGAEAQAIWQHGSAVPFKRMFGRDPMENPREPASMTRGQSPPAKLGCGQAALARRSSRLEQPAAAPARPSRARR